MSNITSTVNVFYSSTNLTGSAVIIVTIIGILILSLTLLPVFQRFQRVLSKVGRIFFLTIKGGGITLTGYGIYTGLTWLLSFSEYIEFQPIWVAYGVGGFAGLTSLGYLGEKVWNKIEKNYHTLNPKQEIEEAEKP